MSDTLKLTDLSTVRELLSTHGMTMKKKFGQNFLVNEAVPKRIAAKGATEGCGVLEIGPGIGTMTRELASIAKKVVAVEIDRDLLPILNETLADFPNTKVISGDILQLDLATLIQEEFQGVDQLRVCANLPYYITTPILMHLLESNLPFRSITVMVQKEVADRLCATPGSAAYGAITLAIAYRGKAKKCFTVSPGNFFPPPSVDSSVVRIDLFEEPLCRVSDEALLFRIIKAAFGQRRKTLQNALSAEFTALSKNELALALEDAGLSPCVRGEKLSVKEFALLCEQMAKKIS